MFLGKSVECDVDDLTYPTRFPVWAASHWPFFNILTGGRGGGLGTAAIVSR